MPETPKQLKVFLCHSSHDKPVVRELYQRLCAESWIDPWLDEQKLLPGQDWNTEIEKAVESSHIVLVLLTNNSVNKEGYIQRELRLVLDVALNMPEDTIFVIPLKLEECQMPRRLQPWQWLNYFPAEERANAYDRLLVSFRIRASKLGISFPTGQPKKEKPASTFQKMIPSVAKSPLPFEPTHSDLDLYIPPEYLGQNFTPPPARVKTWFFGGIEFVKVPHGNFLMGSRDDNTLAEEDEKPQHTYNIPYDFLMARFPTTNEQFDKFVQAIGYLTTVEEEEYGWTWNGNEWTHIKDVDWKHPGDPKIGIEGLSKYPVAQIAWSDVLAYCDWLNEEFGRDIPSGLIFRPPTEAEWEKAARGMYGREYPWGNQFIPTYCNSQEGGLGRTTPVGAYSPLGDSPYGVCDMSGNVWEWTASLWGSDGAYANFKYPYNRRDGREDMYPGKDVFRILRGGSFVTQSQRVRAAVRYGGRVSSNYFGFRVVLAPRLL